MTYPVLLIYDNTGKVWAVCHNETTVPSGVQGIIADAPSAYKSVKVDVATKTAIFERVTDTEDEITNLQNAIVELEARVAELEG